MTISGLYTSLIVHICNLSNVVMSVFVLFLTKQVYIHSCMYDTVVLLEDK
jgi:hypothetical protein